MHHQFKLPSYHDSALPHCRTFEDSTCFVMSIQNGKSRAQWIITRFFRWCDCSPGQGSTFSTSDFSSLTHLSLALSRAPFQSLFEASFLSWFCACIPSLIPFVYPIVSVGTAYPYDSLLDQLGMTSWPSSSGARVYSGRLRAAHTLPDW